MGEPATMNVCMTRQVRWSRRRVLEAGALPFLGLGLSQLLAAEATSRAAGRPRREKSCIFIFQYGGLSQIDSWDPKPDGPSEIRGPYRPIATSVPGFHVGELMPCLARLADRYCVIRSMTHHVPVHDIANRMLLAGRSRPAMTAPSFGTVVAKLRPSGEGVPSQVWLQKFGGGSMPPDSTYLTGGILGMAHAPMLVGVEHDDNPANPDFRVDAFDMPDGLSLDRARGRIRPLGQVDPDRDAEPSPATLARSRERAVDLIDGSAARRAFDIDREDPRARDRYGRHPLGQNLLMARRLIEA